MLPNYSILHKQDIFITEKYEPDIRRDELSFLSRSFERHFNERPYLHHACYLFLTKTTKERSRQQSNWNTLCRGFLVPKEIRDKEMVERFMEAVGQFESIVNDSGLVRLERLTTEEITGTENEPGIIERYLTLSADGTSMLQDMQLNPDEMRIGDKRLCLHTLSDLDDLPGKVRTDGRYERLSTDRSDCRLSYAAPVGVMLPCDHIYNQWIFIDDSNENLSRFEKMAKNMQSLSRYSRSNQINKEWLDEYLNEAHSNGLQSVRCHCNIIAWAENGDELRRVKNDVGSALALMECTPHHNTTDLPALYWAGIPGNEADFPAEETFYTFTGQALCFFTAETCYRNSLSPFGIRMVDRLTGKPVFLDISDLPMKKGVVTNRNKFILGPSGSGKSFFTNHLVRQYWEQGTHILLVDTGNSYKGLCDLIHQKTGGDDGIYCKYSINSLVYWVTYVHNVVYSFYRSMIYCYINSTQRCAGSIVIDIIPTNGADKRKFFPFAPYFPVTNVIKRYFYPYFPAIIGIKGYSFPYFPYLSGIMKIKTALYSLFSRLDWHKTVVFPCLGEIYEGIRSLSWEIPVT